MMLCYLEEFSSEFSATKLDILKFNITSTFTTGDIMTPPVNSLFSKKFSYCSQVLFITSSLPTFMTATVQQFTEFIKN